MMRFHYLQHVAFEDAASIGQWAAAQGHSVSCTRLYAGEALPAQDDFDWLAVMGGPMNIYEHEEYPWLVDEKRFLRETIDRGAVVIGVCLGAQLLADVLGGEVTRNAHKEIGWHPATLTPEGRESELLSEWPDEFMACHWHGDMFSIPPGAVHLASSEACANQGFVYDERVVGLQFHMEYLPDSVEAMLTHCADELVDGPWIQSEDELRDGCEHIPTAQAMLGRLLSRLHG